MPKARESPTFTRRSLLGTAVLAVSSTVGSALVAACGQAAAPAATSQPAQPAAPTSAAATAAPTTAPAATAAPAGQKVTITVFNRQTPSNETPKGAVDDYQTKHPNVTIDWQSAPPGADLQKMLVLAAAGTSPDIQWQCLLCNYHQFILAGLVLEHDPLVKAHNYAIDTQMPQAMANATVNGKLYGLPQALHPSYPCVIINKTMFEKGGVPVPKEDWTTGQHPGWTNWTFDDMRSAAVALTKSQNGRVQQWGLQMRGSANPFDVIQQAIRAEGGDMFSSDGNKLTWNSDAGRKATKYYVDLYTKDKVAPLTPDMPTGGPDLMASGRVAIRNAPVWAILTAKQTFKDFDWMILPAPRGTAGTDGNVEPNFFSIQKATKNPDVAFDVLIDICDPQWAWKSVDLGGIPGSEKEFWTPDSRLAKDPNFAIFARMMNTVSPNVLPANGRRAELVTQWTAAMDPVWLGQSVDSNALIDQLTPKLQAILESKPASIQELAAPKP
jgi:multiple sugar transport system substrate-binding protein